MAQKLSQTLLEYAAPLLEHMPPGASFSQRHSVLQVVITVWNARVVAQWGQHDMLPDLYRRLEQMPEPNRSTMREMIDLLVERKRSLFPNELRAVGNWELRVKHNGDLALWAEARGPLP
jgi:hypothetical protein